MLLILLILSSMQATFTGLWGMKMWSWMWDKQWNVALSQKQRPKSFKRISKHFRLNLVVAMSKGSRSPLIGSRDTAGINLISKKQIKTCANGFDHLKNKYYITSTKHWDLKLDVHNTSLTRSKFPAACVCLCLWLLITYMEKRGFNYGFFVRSTE